MAHDQSGQRLYRLNEADSMSAAMTALQKQLDVKAARDAFLERATRQSAPGIAG